ncbi:MAG: hypothetical protein HOE30_15355 [Deltaproteobacteria bacterium]|jgi:hypothetical protein|nr:hypothetical protein [Deltaproteobacteria bacterium]MBT4264425.1 hypothetical protein [Deltaproteobacteria bacterium]MBT4643088.1 hypothetical protein [Deltaproteobacteria bacterium]MBT6498886.1 hypothetical protein [Deltaproteobacteria bacterium]MBT6615807.1 hypothetical protein [Deltaproteobacteria bacterium]
MSLISKIDAYVDQTDEAIENLIDSYVNKFFGDRSEDVVRIRRNIWTVREDLYAFNIIITSLLVIFDAILFDELPENRQQFFEELLSLNAHQAKSSKLCLLKGTIHLRIIRGLEDFDYSEFAAHVEEFRDIFPLMQENLIDTFYPDA